MPQGGPLISIDITCGQISISNLESVLKFEIRNQKSEIRNLESGSEI